MSLPIEQQVDYHFLRLPYEVVAKKFKESRKSIEKQMASILQSALKVTDATHLDYSLSRLNILKQELSQQQDMLRTYLIHLQERVQLGECSHSLKLQRGVIDYLLRMGYISTALQLISSYKIDNFTQIECALIQESNRIIKELKSKKIHSAMIWCKQNRTKLKSVQSQFENNLAFQQYIEILKLNQPEALQFLRQNVESLSQDSIQKAMGCMIMINNIGKRPQYYQYFDGNQWDQLIAMFKKDFYELFCLNIESPLCSALKCGISTLKTIYCDQIQYKKQNNNCPICNVQVQKLSKQLLSTQKLGSTWICRISGELMDENNPPFILPNNQVYSQKALMAMSTRTNGIVVCPTTKQEFKIKDCVRVYLT